MRESRRRPVSNLGTLPGDPQVAWTGSRTTIVLASENEGQLAEAAKRRTENRKLEQGERAKCVKLPGDRGAHHPLMIPRLDVSPRAGQVAGVVATGGVAAFAPR